MRAQYAMRAAAQACWQPGMAAANNLSQDFPRRKRMVKLLLGRSVRISFANGALTPLALNSVVGFEFEVRMVSKDFLIRLGGYGLTTAEIHYHMPDHPKLLQQFVWQEYDIAPDFPTLKKFLDFWQSEIEGALHSVRVAHDRLLRPSEWKSVRGVFQLN
jgi:uncharacterized protein Usg